MSRRRRSSPRELPAILPNVGIRALYRRRLSALIQEMSRSYLHWVRAQYRATPPAMAQDSSSTPRVTANLVNIGSASTPRWLVYIDGDLLRKSDGTGRWFKSQETAEIAGITAAGPNAVLTHAAKNATISEMAALPLQTVPARSLEDALRSLGVRWQDRFNAAAPKLAAYFAQSVRSRTERRLKEILRDAGISVKFTMTPQLRDIMRAQVAENVSLIRSIPQQYHTQIEGLVMRSVSQGRDIGYLTKELQDRYNVTEKRAKLIAYQQNNAATSAIRRERETAAGIEQGVWLHSHGGKEPRPTHVRNHGNRFNLSEGWYDPAERKHIWPGQLINCFLGSTEVQFIGSAEKAYRHRYCGDLTEIVTDTSKTLCTTPNHPILTPHGWASAGSLNEGDNLVEIADHGVHAIMAKGYRYDAPALLSQVFDALRKSGQRRLEITLGDDFHGDIVPNSDVEIVFADSPLRFMPDPSLAQSACQRNLSMTDQARLFLRTLHQRIGGIGLSTPRCVSTGGEMFSFLGSGLLHSKPHAFASIANRPTRCIDPVNNGNASDVKPSRQSKDAFAPLVGATQHSRIAHIYTAPFDGHVYNLQTSLGWYSASGIIVHNCRCVWKAVVPGFT